MKWQRIFAGSLFVGGRKEGKGRKERKQNREKEKKGSVEGKKEGIGETWMERK